MSKTLSQIMTQAKHLYLISDDNTKACIGADTHYDDNNAIMWAKRRLTTLKRQGKAPSHATLWISLQPYGYQQIQGFYRR